MKTAIATKFKKIPHTVDLTVVVYQLKVYQKKE